MHRCKPLDGFQLDDDPSFDQKVGAKSLVERDSVIHEADESLPFDEKTTTLERTGKQHLVDRLEKPRPQVTMNSHRRIDDRAGDLIELRRFLVCTDRTPTTGWTRAKTNLRELRVSA